MGGLSWSKRATVPSPTLAQSFILPAAGIIVGPLPFPGLAVEVIDELTLEIVEDGLRYRVAVPGVDDEDSAQRQLEERLRADGAAPGWAVAEGRRFYIARESEDGATRRVGLITRVGDDGPVTVIERRDPPEITESGEFERQAEKLFDLAALWLKTSRDPVHAEVHAALSALESGYVFFLPPGRVPVALEGGLAVVRRLRGVERARLAVGAVAAATGEDADGVAHALADDAGVHEARVRSVDGGVAEVVGLLRPAGEDPQRLRCRVIPAEDGRGFAACTLRPEWEEADEVRRVMATITKWVSQVEVPDDVLTAPAASLAEVLAEVGHFRHRTDADGRRVLSG